ncbi:DUF3263 domain-containing protein [Demequina pelophila]|uniref:DUF3263 domain-containing protein n=1 Tax=Demequina pelophila TaxID=1638984 RepID=UPI0009E290FA|nr:DUF3263 domain-containing protein [Demequina pelophila]
MDTAAAHPLDPAEQPLDEHERAVLAFERRWWRFAGAKEDAIRAELGLTVTEYYQVLGSLVDRTAALAAEPMVVQRLRRMRAARQRGASSTTHPGGRPNGATGDTAAATAGATATSSSGSRP